MWGGAESRSETGRVLFLVDSHERFVILVKCHYQHVIELFVVFDQT